MSTSAILGLALMYYKSFLSPLIPTNDPTTVQDCGVGPFTIMQIHTNSTITFQYTPHIMEQINICQVKSYWH